MDAPLPAHERLTFAGFVMAGIAVAALTLSAYWVSEQQAAATASVTHTHEVRAAIARARAALTEVRSHRHDPDPRMLGAALAGFDAEMGALRSLTSDNSSQRARLDEVDTARASLAGDLAPEREARLRELFAGLDREEQRLLARRLNERDATLATFWLVTGLLVAVLLAALGVLYSLAQRRASAQHALAQSEQRFHLMTQSVLDYAILMLDPEGRVASWNAGAQRIKGYRLEEIIGEHFSRFYPPADIAAGKPARELEVAAAEGRFEDEGWRLRKDGTRFWANVVITALRDESAALRGFAKVTRDLTERKRAEEALHDLNRSLESRVAERTAELTRANDELTEAKARLQDLSARLITAQEEERKRISRELHDETGQALTGIRLRLKDAQRNDGERAQRIEECLLIVDEAVKQIRSLAVNLRPPMLDDLGLRDALEWALGQQAKAAGWHASLEAEAFDGRLPPEVETACFRIGQEALTNAARHARASEVRVCLRMVGGVLELTIVDNGRGFDMSAFVSREERRKHFGLVSMRERAGLVGGTLEVDSAAGEGTRIRATFPAFAAA